MNMQFFDGYANKFYELSGETLKEAEAPVRGEPLAVLLETTKIKTFRFAKKSVFQKFIKQYAKTRAVSVFESGEYYVVFSEGFKVIQAIYEQFSVNPFPYQVFFLNYLRKKKTDGTSIFIEIAERSVRITTVTEYMNVSSEIANIQSVSGLIQSKVSGLQKQGFKKINFFGLSKEVQVLVPESETLSYSELFDHGSADIDEFIYEEPKEKIKEEQIRDFKFNIALVSTAFLLFIFSFIVFKTLKARIISYNRNRLALNALNTTLDKKLKLETGKRFVYILRKQPRYAYRLKNLLGLFPNGAHVKQLTVSRGGISLLGSYKGGYRNFVLIFDTLETRLKGSGYRIKVLSTGKAKLYFYISGGGY
jgi:hypothetical protein